MKDFDSSSCFYNEIINLIDLDNYRDAIQFIRNNIKFLGKTDDIALAFMNCGFLNFRLGEYISAIDDFTKSIYYEDKLENINQRSKDISFNGRSNSKYKNQDYKGAIEDKRKAKKIRLLEIAKFPEVDNSKIDYKKILLGTFIEIDLEPKYNTLIKASKIERGKYDLIADYKKVISKKKKAEVIKKLELLSESKYEFGDYKGSIKAIRRAEKYYS